MSQRLCNRFRNSRRETQARKQLEKEKHKTWFYNEKTRLRLAEVSFLFAKTAMCKRSLRLVEVVEPNFINFLFENITNERWTNKLVLQPKRIANDFLEG